ncbi:MAG: hypothetical protein HQ522_18580 [Bacteroidetes bacterium]|nr:hypothetical protein [Bacteroidota bacterium]
MRKLSAGIDDLFKPYFFKNNLNSPVLSPSEDDLINLIVFQHRSLIRFGDTGYSN